MNRLYADCKKAHTRPMLFVLAEMARSLVAAHQEGRGERLDGRAGNAARRGGREMEIRIIVPVEGRLGFPSKVGLGCAATMSARARSC
jgi:hypothetical protein